MSANDVVLWIEMLQLVSWMSFVTTSVFFVSSSVCWTTAPLNCFSFLLSHTPTLDRSPSKLLLSPSQSHFPLDHGPSQFLNSLPSLTPLLDQSTLSSQFSPTQSHSPIGHEKNLRPDMPLSLHSSAPPLHRKQSLFFLSFKPLPSPAASQVKAL